MRTSPSWPAGPGRLPPPGSELSDLFGFEGNVADLVDDQQRVAAQADQFGLPPPGVVGLGEPVDPLRGGGEQHPCPA